MDGGGRTASGIAVEDVRERPSMEVRCAAMFDHRKWLNIKESENRAFRFPCPEKSRMD
jgi:hypothetical protein